ncbi:FRG domain-containing protein [Serratia marcescens]|uniref:FRG domain-containing protein n=1 Tax=Serratia marcescens TaxID=615 RepID=UPI0021834E67|nr:FRG domain-containing protein [Serratia marcescens]CAI2523811.1 FRG domain [Serratia marcescens]
MKFPFTIETIPLKNGLYKFKFKTANDKSLFESEPYTSKESLLEHASSLLNSIGSGAFNAEVMFDEFRKPFIKFTNHDGFTINSSSFDNYESAKSLFSEFIDIYKNLKDAGINFDEGVIYDGEVDNSDNRVTSVVDFMTRISNMEREKGCLYYFRGHSDYRYELVPGIYRKEKRWINHEHKLFREIMLKCPNDFKGNQTTFQNLVKMQHYALPTRLLDITSNALMALYFACVGQKERSVDGEVVIFKVNDTEVKYFDDYEVSLLSNLSKQDYVFRIVTDFTTGKDKYTFPFSMKGIDINIKRLIDAVQRDGCYIDDSIRDKDLNKVVCVKPEMDNPRIIRQDGAFLLFGMDKAKKMPPVFPESYLYDHPDGKIIINYRYKNNIVSELESLGISSSGVYPEIEHVASHIKNKYS